MKFSLASLLAVTLLAALAMSLALQHNRTTGLQQELQLLREEEFVLRDGDGLRPGAAGTDRLLALCEGPINSVTFPTKQLGIVESKFEELREKYGRLDIQNPDLIAVRGIPSHTGYYDFEFACRVYIPDGEVAGLEMFASEFETRGVLKRSHFDFAGTQRHALPPGQSVIVLRWHLTAESPTLSVVLNDETILTARHSGEAQAGWQHQSINHEQFELKNRDSLSLIRFGVACEGPDHDFNLVLKRVGERDGNE